MQYQLVQRHTVPVSMRFLVFIAARLLSDGLVAEAGISTAGLDPLATVNCAIRATPIYYQPPLLERDLVGILTWPRLIQWIRVGLLARQ